MCEGEPLPAWKARLVASCASCASCASRLSLPSAHLEFDSSCSHPTLQHGSDCWWTMPIEALLPPSLAHMAPKLRKGEDTMDVWFDRWVTSLSAISFFDLFRRLGNGLERMGSEKGSGGGATPPCAHSFAHLHLSTFPLPCLLLLSAVAPAGRVCCSRCPASPSLPPCTLRALTSTAVGVVH